MKLKFYTIRVVFIIVVCASFGKQATAQVSGTVFRDINSNGIHDISSPQEPGEFGVTVRAYDAVNNLLGIALTDAAGAYNFSAAQVAPGVAARLEFINATGNYPSKRIAANKSNVQFVTGGSSNIDYAVASKKLLSDNNDPYMATTAATNGNALATGPGNAGDNDNLYVFPYDLSNDGGSSRRTKNQYTGSVYGLAWQRESRILLMAAYLKTHAGFGSGGIGAIYQSQISTTGVPANPSLLLNVTALGLNVGSDPRVDTLPDASSVANTDIGVFAEIGKRGIGGLELAGNGRDLYLVNMFEKKLQRINIGNPLKSSFSSEDVTGSWVIPDPGVPGTEWRPMALKANAGKMYVGGVCSRQVTGNYNSSDTTNLCAVVYEINIESASPSFTEVLRFPLTHRRGFSNNDYRYANRNNYWSAWQNNGDVSFAGPLRSDLQGDLTGDNATGIYYSQPMFGSIEFDLDGSMIIALRDRFGDQGGYQNFFESGNTPGERYNTLSSGELLRAGRTGSAWTLENAATVSSAGVTTVTAGVADNDPALTGSFAALAGTPWGGSYGPGGAYYYYNHNFTGTNVPAPFGSDISTSHYLKSMGGIAFLPGHNEIVTTAIDPVSAFYTSGIIKNYNLGSNAGNMSGTLALITPGSGGATNMGKAAALGELEVLLDAQTIEIGNRVWNDLNANGRQDADEPGINNVTVVLRSPGSDGLYNTGDDQTWSVVTDGGGNYYFDNSFVNDTRRPVSWIGVSATNSGILPGFEYKVEIDGTQASLTGLLLTAAHISTDETDSDGSYNVVNAEYIINPGGSTAPGSSFENNYNIDFGFASSGLLASSKLSLVAGLISTDVNLVWKTADELDIKKYDIERSTDGQYFSAIGSAVSKGNGSFVYTVKDNIENLAVYGIYYRVKVTALSGKVYYSETVMVNRKPVSQVTVSPNPFTSFIRVQLSSQNNGEAFIRVMNAGGQLVSSKTIQLVQGQNAFNISGLGNLSKGLYFLEIRRGNNITREKIMK